MTALDLIKRAMRLIRVLGDGEEPTTSEADDCLNALNGMLDSWAIERLMVYQIGQESFAWASGASKTIGSGGDFDTTRPTNIEAAYVNFGGTDYPLRVVNNVEYDFQTRKDTSAMPEILYYDKTYPLGTIYLWPKPSEAVTLYFRSWTQFTQAVSTASTISLPPGYKRMIEYNLALEIAPEFGATPDANVVNNAVTSKRAIKARNAPAMISRVELSQRSVTDQYLVQ